jgi:hypothetical protein
MRCIFYTGEKCEATPPGGRFVYEPDEKEKNEFCNSMKFQECPRYDAFMDYLKAIKSSR